MITQLIIDWVGNVAALLLAAIPAPPAFLDDVVTAINGMTESTSGFDLGYMLSMLGVLFPWDTVWACIQWWLGAVTFWVAMTALRAILLAFGR